MVAERPRRMNPATLPMAEIGEPANVFTDALIHYIAETQDASGAWSEQVSRPPLQESDIMFAIMALKTYGWPARRAEFDERIARARGWLLTAQTWTTVDEADRLMGLWLAGANQTDLRESGRNLCGSGARTAAGRRPGIRMRTRSAPPRCLIRCARRACWTFRTRRTGAARDSCWIASFRMDRGTCEAAQ
jgi:hypothetical protein